MNFVEPTLIASLNVLNVLKMNNVHFVEQFIDLIDPIFEPKIESIVEQFELFFERFAEWNIDIIESIFELVIELKVVYFDSMFECFIKK